MGEHVSIHQVDVMPLGCLQLRVKVIEDISRTIYFKSLRHIRRLPLSRTTALSEVEGLRAARRWHILGERSLNAQWALSFPSRKLVNGLPRLRNLIVTARGVW